MRLFLNFYTFLDIKDSPLIRRINKSVDLQVCCLPAGVVAQPAGAVQRLPGPLCRGHVHAQPSDPGQN